MKLSGLRSISKGVMLYFLVFVIGCAVQTKESKTFYNSYNFSKLYYITKEPQKSDERFLKDVIANGDEKIGCDATILLGGYYYKLGKYDDALKLFNKCKSKDMDVEYAKSLWLFDINLKKNNKNGVQNALKEALKFNNRNSLSLLICKNYSLKEVGNKCLMEIYRNRYEKVKKEMIKEVKEERVEEVTIKEDVKKVDNTSVTQTEEMDMEESNNFINNTICLSESGLSSDDVNGMLLNIKNNKLDIILESKENCKGRWFYNVKTDELVDKEFIDSINFALNYKELYDEIKNYLLLNGVENFNVITSVDINDDNITIVKAEQRRMKEFFTIFNDEHDQDNETQYFVFLGSSDNVFKYVPLIKYYAKNPEKIKIIVGTDSLNKKFFSENFIDYFLNTVIATPVCDLCKEDLKIINGQYKEFYGENLSFESLVGYDVVTFIKSELNGYFNGVKYMSGILGVKGGHVYRNFYFYEIAGKRRIKTLN